MKLLSYFIILSFSFNLVQAQHSSLSLGDINYNILLNPALTGNYGFLSSSLSFRNDWILDEKHPKSTILSVHTPIKKDNWNLGVALNNEVFGNFSHNSIQLFTAYNLKTTNGIFSFGIKSGLSNLKINSTDFILLDANDKTFEDKMSFFSLNLGFGIHFKSENCYLGLSIPEISGINSSNLNNAQSKSYWQKILLAGYSYVISDKLTLENHFSLRRLGSGKILAQYIPIISINKIYYAGIIARGGNAYGAVFRYQLNEKLKIGYNFDYNFIKTGPKSIGNHELVLTYNFVELVETFNPKFF